MIMLIAASVLSGAIGGMGIGGGVVLIPVLTALFGVSQKSAQYINLLYFLPVALCALAIHARNKRLSYKTALWISIGGIAGALAGSTVAMGMNSDILRRLFGFFLLFIGISQIKSKDKKHCNRKGSDACVQCEHRNI